MSPTLNTALDQVKMARVQVFPRSVRKQINLFEDDISAEITFNGYNDQIKYQQHLESLYIACKHEIGHEVNLRLNQLDELKRQFDLAKYEVREFRQWYFPKNDIDTLFLRVEFVKSPRIEHIHADGIKKNPQLFPGSTTTSRIT